MSRILDIPVKKRRLQYDRSNLTRAYDATLKGMSVCAAARQYQVPESTLRDRTRGNVAVDAETGHGTFFSVDEEKKLVDHLIYMGGIGYGYQKSEVQYMALDYAVSLGKDVKAKGYLSNCWFYGFLGRWPDLKVVKPQKLSISRAKAASSETLANYYKELGTIITSSNLQDKPERMWNIDETGLSTEHSPPKIVCSKDTNPQAVTSPRGSIVTLIASGNALGNSIPPYYVFPGQRWNNELLNGAPARSDGEMTKSGWSNMSVFQNYLTKHFMKYSNVQSGSATEPTLVLYDGHRSHISLTLTDWAKRNNVILFVLPPHTSHLTQPLDVAIFSPFKSIFYHECQAYMRKNPGMTITKYQIAELSAKPYLKSMTAENLTSAFRKTGIYPFNSKLITASQVAPATIYRKENPEETTTYKDSQNMDNSTTETQQNNQSIESSDQITDENGLLHSDEATKSPVVIQPNDFFQARTITNIVKPKPKKKFIPPLISGNLLKKSVTETLQEQSAKKSQKNVMKNEQSKVKEPKPKKKTTVKRSVQGCKKVGPKVSESSHTSQEPVPSTSGLNNKSAITEDSYECSGNSDSEEEKCCVCGKWEPEAIKGCVSLIFVKWAKCDVCSHWTHLQFCSKVKFLRRGSEFQCPHCVENVQ